MASVRAPFAGCASGIGARCPAQQRRPDSTGGQATVSPHVDFAAVALACGYRLAASCDGLTGFDAALREALAAEGPAFVHMRIEPGSLEKLGRPTIPPQEVARRFKRFIAAA
jgi:phosphonopyruvate decarboxylase